MNSNKPTKKLRRLAYFSSGTILALVTVLFLIIVDASSYEERDGYRSPYDKDATNLFSDCTLADSKDIAATYRKIKENLQALKKIKRLVGCQINFDDAGGLYAYQFYFDIKPKNRFAGTLVVSVGTGLIEEFDGISAYEQYTHFWFDLTEPRLFSHAEITDGTLEKRISDLNERIEENPNKIRSVYVGRDKTEFRFENGEESVWDKIEYR